MSTSMRCHTMPFRIGLFVPSVDDLERRTSSATITKFNTCIILNFPTDSTSLKRPFIPHSASASHTVHLVLVVNLQWSLTISTSAEVVLSIVSRNHSRAQRTRFDIVRYIIVYHRAYGDIVLGRGVGSPMSTAEFKPKG